MWKKFTKRPVVTPSVLTYIMTLQQGEEKQKGRKIFI
jgi:hypothetical protein